jgi:2-oxoglutarate/2-oxoacid ferredoxin oxidoreductase subunit beta
MTTTDLPTVQSPAPALTRRDFVPNQEVRWCPGCGDYAILAQMQRIMPELGIPRENIVFISGIGCSSRFPYYMNTYGMHTIHGRAPTFATGLKIANPDLSVWVITGDGDGLSIGGNHFMHLLRRNVDLNIILFNNRIYGLTKGQYSPTTPMGTRNKTAPMGIIEKELNPLSVAIGVEATFAARTADRLVNHLADTLRAAAAHKGTSFVEVLQNCNVFNDGAWLHVTEKEHQADNVLFLEDGKPMVFGADRDKGIRARGLDVEVVTLGENGVTEADLLVHDPKGYSAQGYLLSRMAFPTFPVPLGVFRHIERPTYETSLVAQNEAARARQGAGSLHDLFFGGDTWEVE